MNPYSVVPLRLTSRTVLERSRCVISIETARPLLTHLPYQSSLHENSPDGEIAVCIDVLPVLLGRDAWLAMLVVAGG